MDFSFTSFLTILFFSSVVIIFMCLILKSSRLIKHIGVSILSVCLMAIIIRLFLPYEFTFAKELGLSGIYSEFVFFLKVPLAEIAGHTINLYESFYLVIFLGILVNFIKTIVSYKRFERVICSLPDITNQKINYILHIILKDYKRKIPFIIKESPLVSTPMIFRITKPLIILPEIDLSEDEWYYILKHEVAHYYRGDLHIKIITELLAIIYWWNPFIYLLKKQISKILEIRIDVAITHSLSEIEKIKYIECLLKIAKNQISHKQKKVALSFGSDECNTISQRSHIVLDDYPALSKFKYLVLIVPLILVILSYSFVFEPYSINSKDQSYTVELTTSNSYLVENPNGGYDLYFDDKYFGTVTLIKDSYSNLPVYKNIKEAPKK